MLLLPIVALLHLLSGRAARSQDATGSRFVCNAIPPGAEPGCGYDAAGNRIQGGGGGTVEEELRNTIIHLRETILQQKEVIVSHQGTIKELNSKLARCEAAADESTQQGKSRGGAGSRRKEQGKNTMGDLPRDPGETIDQLGKTMQSLKGRLESLEVSSCVKTHHVRGGGVSLMSCYTHTRERHNSSPSGYDWAAGCSAA